MHEVWGSQERRIAAGLVRREHMMNAEIEQSIRLDLTLEEARYLKQLANEFVAPVLSGSPHADKVKEFQGNLWTRLNRLGFSGIEEYYVE